MIRQAVSVLTFDIGTSSVKAGVFDRHTLVCSWEHRTALRAPEHEHGVYDPNAWLEALESICAALPTGPIDAVALSGNGPTVIPVDAHEAPADGAYLWFGTNERRIEANASFFLPKIAWIRENRPAVYARTRRFMTCPEYLSFVLGADPHTTSPSVEFDPYVWDSSGAAAYGVDPALLPPVVRPGTVVGRVSEVAAGRFGLPAGTPIVTGGPDFLASLLGTAAVVPGRTCDRAGTSEGINFCSAVPVADVRVRTLPHAVEGHYNVAGLLSSTGRIFEWFRRITHQQGRSYDRMLGEIESAGLERRPLFFPSSHAGAAWGFSTGAFVGLHSDHTAVDLGRAVVLSIGFAVRQSIEILREVGCDVETLRVCGGQARNEIWNQMKADITGCAISVPAVLDAELVGGAICALKGLGEVDDLGAAAGELVRFDHTLAPRPTMHDELNGLFAEYISRYETGRFFE